MVDKNSVWYRDDDESFLEIYDIIEGCMKAHQVIAKPTLRDILTTESWVYDHIENMTRG